MRVLCKDIAGSNGQEVEVKGWIHRIRDLGGVCFIMLRDRSGMVQLIFESAPDVTLESVVSVEGTVQENQKAPDGYEIQVSTMKVLSRAAADLPIQVNGDPDKLGIEAILDNRVISLRNPKIRSIFHLQSNILAYFAEYLRSQDFTEIKSSKLIGSGSEGGTGLFEVEYFDRKVYLAQSPQLYKQTMVASGMERVFEIGAAYRAEKHDTPRHLNEYVSLDVEMGFIESDQDLMDLETGILKHIFGRIAESDSAILEQWGASVPSQEALDHIPRISHDEAKAILSERLGKRVFELNPEGERELCEWALENHGVELVFVNAFPRKKRPFYTYPDGMKTMSFDLLFRGLEITSGSRRINEYDMLVENIKRFGLDPAGLAGYLEVFKYGAPPHGGFAIGLERFTQKVLGLSSIKEASLFPRDRKRVTP
ncbi:aspartate--tRNA(Asn) ligase [Sediminispirochaeta bajacaliforniensis]|uniref:aspartate--tRNA(Asn) ligase n=1 Tax=Sediminispirochaeta bajacaliforniensis TaxID=148 RepID=UPI00036A1AB4|nr:aspartate--tRNA(Asn) ligase [Sediminispirochaeta bajacaliforniensis]